jgi:hypothetical protein
MWDYKSSPSSVEGTKMQETEPRAELGLITTEWALVFDPVQFVKRYANAVERYLLALIKNREDAAEAAQNFFLWVTEHGFPRARRDRGRFRDYLKVAVRNAGLNYIQRQKGPRGSNLDFSSLSVPDDTLIPEQEWIVQWRQCLLRRAWKALKKHEEQAPQTLCHTVLRLKAANPREHSKTLSARAAALVGRPIRRDAFRKQVSRARRLFAKLLVDEVAETLDKPTPDAITEELVDLGLFAYVRDLVPESLQHSSCAQKRN